MQSLRIKYKNELSIIKHFLATYFSKFEFTRSQYLTMHFFENLAKVRISLKIPWITTDFKGD